MRSGFVALAIPVLLLALLPGAASASGSRSAAAHRASVLAYWTPARIASARPRDFTFDAVRGFQPSPKARPGPGSGSGNVTGASWTTGGAILKGSGRVLFSLPGGDYICSGSVVTDTRNDHSVVLTAGHCVVENDGTFASNWVFYPEFDTQPSYDCETRALGCWVADDLWADKTFANTGSFNNAAVTHDFAFATVSTGGATGESRQLDAAVGGSFDIAYSDTDPKAGDTLAAFGYPAAASTTART
jgi:hypothetical protein